MSAERYVFVFMLQRVSEPLQLVNTLGYESTSTSATIRIMDDSRPSRRFGRNLRRLREAYGLTMQEFAERVSIAYSSQRALETGRRVPSTDLLARIAQELGVAMDDLYRDGDIDEIVEAIEQRRAAVRLYGMESAASMMENVQIFTSMMREIDRLNLPDHVKQMLRDDVERTRREARQSFPPQ